MSESYLSGLPHEIPRSTLVDNNLSPVLADILRAAGPDVSHVRQVGLQSAADEVVLDSARAEHRVVSADTDFGALLSRSGAKFPSVLVINVVLAQKWPAPRWCSAAAASNPVFDHVAPNYRTARKNVRMPGMSSCGVPMAAKWPPWPKSLQWVMLWACSP